MTKKEKRITELMQKLKIAQCCVSVTRFEHFGKNKKRKFVLSKELMIEVENLDQNGKVLFNGSICFLPAREFSWGKNRKYLVELTEMLGTDT